MGRRILEINEAERTWIAGNQQVVRSFAIERGVLLDKLAPLDPPVLDAAWAAWLEMHVRGEDDPNSIINAFGMALGQVLIDRLGLEWKIVSDAVTEIALCGQPGDIVIYPQNLVARRYMSGTTQFFVELAAEMEQSLGRLPGHLAAGPPAEPPSPVIAAPVIPAARRAKAVGPGRRKRAKSAAGPGKPAVRAAAAPPGPAPSASSAKPVESVNTVESVAAVESPKPLESTGGGFGRIFRRGHR